MKTIWKFELLLSGRPQEVKMPANASIVHFSMQGDVPCFWAYVDPEVIRENRYFAIHGTGHPIPDDRGYRGTCQHGAFVWHLFEQL